MARYVLSEAHSWRRHISCVRADKWTCLFGDAWILHRLEVNVFLEGSILCINSLHFKDTYYKPLKKTRISSASNCRYLKNIQVLCTTFSILLYQPQDLGTVSLR